MPKLLEVVDFWKSLPKSKQPGQGKAGANKSYDTLLLKRNDPLVPVKLRFFEETAKIINVFLVQFQTQSPMVPFLVDCLENIVRGFCDRFILPDIMKKANTTYKLTKLDVMDKNMRDYHFSFSINHELRELKEKGKINDSKLHAYKMEAKDFISTLCNHLLSKSPLTSCFARCAKCLDPTTMGEMPDVCKQSFHKMLEKPVEYKQVTSHVADEAEKEYQKFLYSVVKENKAFFLEFDKSKDRLDEFFMRYLSDTVRFNNFMLIVKMVLTLSHGQADVERGFSVNDKLLVENMQEQSLISQRIVKHHMLYSGYKPHNIPISRDLIKIVDNSCSLFKIAFKEKREQSKKNEKNEKHDNLNEELSQLNHKKTSLEEVIKEYKLQSEKYDFEAEQKENLEILKLSNGLKRAAKEKQAELDNVLAKKKCLAEKKKSIV